VYHGTCKTYQCNSCHAQTTLTSGTIFHKTKAIALQLVHAMYLFYSIKGSVSALELTRHLGICYRSAWETKAYSSRRSCMNDERNAFSRRNALN
jgi:hypothetical protein